MPTVSRHYPTQRRGLKLSLMAVVALALVYGGVISSKDYQQKQQTLTRDLDARAHRAALDVRNLLTSYETALNTIAESRCVQDHDPAHCRDYFPGLFKRYPEALDFVAINRDGKVFASSRSPYLRDPGASHDMAALRVVHDSQKRSGALLQSDPLSGIRSVSMAIALPSASGKYDGALGLALKFEPLQQQWAALLKESEENPPSVALFDRGRQLVFATGLLQPGVGQTAASLEPQLAQDGPGEVLIADQTLIAHTVAVGNDDWRLVMARPYDASVWSYLRNSYLLPALVLPALLLGLMGAVLLRREGRTNHLLAQEQGRLRAAHDQLEQRVAQRTAQLAEREAHYRSLFQLSPEAIFVHRNGQILFANEAAATLFHAPNPEALIGKTWRDLVAEHDSGIVEKRAAALERGEVGSVPLHELSFQALDGEQIQVESAGAAIVVDGASAVMTVAREVTQRKRAEASLRVAAIAFESREAMFVADANQVILQVNQAFTRVTGYSAQEAVGQTPHMLKSGRQDAAFYDSMWTTLKQTGYWQGELWNRRKSGENYPEWLAISAVLGERGEVTNYVAAFNDITQHKEAEEQIRLLAYSDPLTELPNRRLLLDRLQQAFAASARNKRHGALLLIDLDNFRNLNDTLGHDAGDLLLQLVGQRLSHCIREGDTVARVGGDEFAVMLEDLSALPQEALTQTETMGTAILAALNRSFSVAGQSCQSTPSIGATLFNAHDSTVEELLKQTDLAMYRAKAAGRNTLRFFDPEMQAVATERATLETDLREGLQKCQLVLYYQPQVDGPGGVTGFEALVRWQHPQRGLVQPADFIPLAEETGLILPLGQWVLRTACTQLVAWGEHPETAHFTVAVNVSAHQFRHPDFVMQVLGVLEETGADPRKLKLELTESLLVDNLDDVIAKMTALKTPGVRFSLDDFGTGYSSLAYLKRLPLDQLKIDQSFIRDVLTDANDAAIARTIVALARSLGLAVIAEGVETEAQREFLAENGCHASQGYLFGRPDTAESITRPAPLDRG